MKINKHDKNINSKAYTIYESPRKIAIDIAVSSDFIDPNSDQISEYDFIEALTSFYHEAHHALQYLQSNCLHDKSDEVESLLSRYYNNDTYTNEYDKFSFEIAAERDALYNTYKNAKLVCGQLNTDDIILAYVNARAKSSDEYRYFISSESGFTNIDDVFDAFDKAYAKSYITKKRLHIS